jgi:hypothetical protein
MSQPEISFKVGAVRAAIFRNTMQRGAKTINIGKVILEVRYRDKDGQWKSTHSMSANEVPKAILALQKAYEYLMTKKADDATENTDDEFETPNVPVEKIH